ncbi:MAG: TonB family protein [Inquilinus sp.]|uniref:TonB family protein n=1 Tax=Inquilinus sp. TaxID=1932117 RepID=UPI003F2E99D1
MTRPRLSGRGVAYAASALIHGGVVWALLPSLTGSAAPTPAETPMAIEMAGFGAPTEAVDTAEPVETAQPEQIEPTEAVPVETAQTQPVETAQDKPVEDQPVQDQPVETAIEQPPPPAETPVTETTEIQPPEPVPETPPPELVTTTGETEAVVAAVPDTVQAVEPEVVQSEVVPPPTRPRPRAEPRPRREQPRRTEQPAEVSPAPTEQAALPPKPVAQPPAPAAPGGSARAADYQSKLYGYIRQRLNRANIRIRQDTTITIRFTLRSDGSFENPSITVSSGDEDVDSRVLRVLSRLSAPEPPAEFQRQITAPIVLQR